VNGFAAAGNRKGSGAAVLSAGTCRAAPLAGAPLTDLREQFLQRSEARRVDHASTSPSPDAPRSGLRGDRRRLSGLKKSRSVPSSLNWTMRPRADVDRAVAAISPSLRRKPARLKDCACGEWLSRQKCVSFALFLKGLPKPRARLRTNQTHRADPMVFDRSSSAPTPATRVHPCPECFAAKRARLFPSAKAQSRSFFPSAMRAITATPAHSICKNFPSARFLCRRPVLSAKVRARNENARARSNVQQEVPAAGGPAEEGADREARPGASARGGPSPVSRCAGGQGATTFGVRRRGDAPCPQLGNLVETAIRGRVDRNDIERNSPRRSACTITHSAWVPCVGPFTNSALWPIRAGVVLPTRARPKNYAAPRDYCESRSAMFRKT